MFSLENVRRELARMGQTGIADWQVAAIAEELRELAEADLRRERMAAKAQGRR